MCPLVFILLNSLIAISAFAGVDAPKGHVLVTLGGAVSKTNLPVRRDKDGGLFGSHEITCENAVGFDEAMLNALDQVEITILCGPTDKQWVWAIAYIGIE